MPKTKVSKPPAKKATPRKAPAKKATAAKKAPAKKAAVAKKAPAKKAAVAKKAPEESSGAEGSCKKAPVAKRLPRKAPAAKRLPRKRRKSFIPQEGTAKEAAKSVDKNIEPVHSTTR